jgi:hypothetical protein
LKISSTLLTVIAVFDSEFTCFIFQEENLVSPVDLMLLFCDKDNATDCYKKLSGLDKPF